MTETEDAPQSPRAFSSFRALNGDASSSEREQLFHNLAQLFSHVSDRCDDEQVAQYDDVLCQLADLVGPAPRAEVAKLLAPLERAPGKVVVKLAGDLVEIARPLLEGSTVLSDDDLIEIAAGASEAHRYAIAARPEISERVAEAVVQFGASGSVGRLLRNSGSALGVGALSRLAMRAAGDATIAADLRTRTADAQVASGAKPVSLPSPMQATGFSEHDWKIAFNQVKALADRLQLNEGAIRRFMDNGYVHHAAAGLAILLKVPQPVFETWLGQPDYMAVTVGIRALALQPDLFDPLMLALPWRDTPDEADLDNLSRRFETLSSDEAQGIFTTWRLSAFRRRGAAAAAGIPATAQQFG